MYPRIHLRDTFADWASDTELHLDVRRSAIFGATDLEDAAMEESYCQQMYPSYAPLAVTLEVDHYILLAYFGRITVHHREIGRSEP